MNLFKEYGLSEDLLKAITELGYTQPTEIQKQTIPYLLSKEEDLIALAQTGTGKTAAFSLPILEMIDPYQKHVQALILCPTRELCLQISKDIASYSKYLSKIRSLAVYGGSNISEQIRGLKNNPQIVIGTPGRVNDMLKRGVLKINQIQWLILDEADEMLSMGFKAELETILKETPKDRQTLLFSATMSKQVEAIAKNYMKGAQKISAGGINEVKKNITHKFVMVRDRQKNNGLRRVLDANPNIYSIIFCRTRVETQHVADFLMHQGYAADALHGDLSQSQRDMVMKKFRLKNLRILVATDVAARGLDVNDLTHVIHYSLPDDPEVFIHRSGRTGRAGKDGESIAIIRPSEMVKFNRIKKETSIKVEEMKIPTKEDILKAKELYLSDKLLNSDFDSEEFELSTIPDLSNISKEELYKRVMFLELKSTWEFYKNEKDIAPIDKNERAAERGKKSSTSRNRKDRKDSKDGNKRNRKSKKGNFTRFFFNLGKRDNLNKVTVIDLINKNTKGARADIGEIDIRDKFTFFEVDANYTDQLLKKINQLSFNGKNMSLEIAQ
ncbi:DEAD/DEAH box helicase [Apibacter sp. B3706]|uniref:DEAD/DEAH box helicase n=1 Tax=Apibacter TaxID=1778601 RepID=UPI00136838A0|nr:MULTISPECIES: DEAD/DEAH box helicase [Apibacter]MXO33169.1 DEAD/DEAH box helicase [Apibacter sp. B2912]QII70592.1 DEAD/DEAH box helicase [Apibacter sp. B3706]